MIWEGGVNSKREETCDLKNPFSVSKHIALNINTCT